MGNKGLSWACCTVCGDQHLTPTALAEEIMKDGNIERYNYVCRRCDTHDDYCDFRECFWRGSTVFCESCEHKACEMEVDEISIVGQPVF